MKQRHRRKILLSKQPTVTLISQTVYTDYDGKDNAVFIYANKKHGKLTWYYFKLLNDNEESRSFCISTIMYNPYLCDNLYTKGSYSKIDLEKYRIKMTMDGLEEIPDGPITMSVDFNNNAIEANGN